jgi:quercetin dioxygenase-like cupin family protein
VNIITLIRINDLANKPRTGTSIILLLILSLSTAIAQSLALDPVRVAPHIYESLLENERVRVLKVTDRTGETAPLHAHPDRVVVFLSPCAWLETGPDGQSTMQSYKLGDVLWADRVTHGGETSRVVQECSLLEIELK